MIIPPTCCYSCGSKFKQNSKLCCRYKQVLNLSISNGRRFLPSMRTDLSTHFCYYLDVNTTAFGRCSFYVGVWLMANNF